MATLQEILRQLIIDHSAAQYWVGLYEARGQLEEAEEEEVTTERIQTEIDYVLSKLGEVKGG